MPSIASMISEYVDCVCGVRQSRYRGPDRMSMPEFV